MVKEKVLENSEPEKPNVIIKINDVEKVAGYRTFKSGKKGYGAYGIVKVNGYPCRMSLNLIEL